LYGFKRCSPIKLEKVFIKFFSEAVKRNFENPIRAGGQDLNQISKAADLASHPSVPAEANVLLDP